MLAAILLVLPPFAAGAVVGSGDDRGESRATAEAEPGRELPRGGYRVLPDFRVVALYGAPQDPALGALGIGSPDQAARRLADLTRSYRAARKPVLPAFELLATIAAGHPGLDGLYRTRQPTATIRRYLEAVRRIDGLLILDLQPGYADFSDEAKELARFLREPDVGLAMDPEWHVADGEVPGRTIGSVDAEEVNEVSAYLARIVRRHGLPQKLLVVHQFTDAMVGGKRRIEQRPGVAVVFNADGFGTPALKRATYRRVRKSARWLGFKLFFEEDTGLMSPKQVLGLQPPPDLVVYE